VLFQPEVEASVLPATELELIALLVPQVVRKITSVTTFNYLLKSKMRFLGYLKYHSGHLPVIML